MAIVPGTLLSRYEIRSLISKGGMGEVYLAQDTQLHRPVAIKALPAEFTQNKQRLRRFEIEAFAVSALNHPNILTIHEIGVTGGMHFIATEFVDGESLRQRLSNTRMELREVLDVSIQIASALSAAHQAGIAHRDIKPENTMLRHDGYVKVLDFGLAKLTDINPKSEGASAEATTVTFLKTDPGVVVGTVLYMSPEQARGLEVDARTDIWSLGCVIYEMVAGRAPFEGATSSDVIALILQKEPVPLARYAPEIPAELDRIVTKALRKHREERYQVIKDMALDLKSLKQHLEFEAELERSAAPEAVSNWRKEIVPISGQAAATADGAAQTRRVTRMRATSSAEYLVTEIKQHRRGAMLILAMLLAAAAVAIYFSRYAHDSKAAITSMAVLPFINESNDENLEYLSDGISESLINSLSRLPQLKVIARRSSFKYKGSDVDFQEVAKALDVRVIVIGRVMRRGDQLQVSAELVDTRDKSQMWGEQYNRKAADLLGVQSEISQQIAEKLRLRLTNTQQQQIVKDAKANPQAYEIVLKGRFHGRKATPEGLKKYVEYCNQAIAIDPNYALAYAGLADAYRLLSYLDPKEALSKADAAAQTALRLDDSLADAHYALSQIKGNAWDWAGAERENKRAIELNPNFAEAHAGYAYYLSSMGHREEALAEIKLAEELDPLRVGLITAKGVIFYNAREYDKAVEQYNKASELDQNSPTVHAFLGYTYSMKEMYAKAIAEYKEVIRLTEGDDTSVQNYMGYALAMSGQRNEALAILKQLLSSEDYVSPSELAIIYAGLGDKEKAFAALSRAYAEHDIQLQFLKVEPHYDSLRADPRFAALMLKVGLTP
jgi:eukaryotic-like serine/threonine-protein kinase